jgi:hypothetical protein
MKKSEFLVKNNVTNLTRRKESGMRILQEVKDFLGHNQKLKLSKFIIDYYEPLFDELIAVSGIIQRPETEEGTVECYNRKTGHVYILAEEHYNKAKTKFGDTIQKVENPMDGAIRVGDSVCKQ